MIVFETLDGVIMARFLFWFGFFSAQVEGSPCREVVNGQVKVFLTFEQAVLKVRGAGVSSFREYRAWQKDHPDMPSHPERVYAKHWRGWRFFLGTGREWIRKQFLPWEQAVLKARAAGLLYERNYRTWRKDHPDMPSHPERVYAKHWRGWRFFLGTGREWIRKQFLPWEQAVLKVRGAGVSSRREYLRWRKDHPDMPSEPNVVYGKQWLSWGHFLGTL